MKIVFVTHIIKQFVLGNLILIPHKMISKPAYSTLVVCHSI